MKALMLCEFYGEGLEYKENLFAKYCVKHGYEITVITSTTSDVFDYISEKHNKRLGRAEFYDSGVKIIRLPFKYNILNKLKKFISIYDDLVNEKPDIICMHDIMLNISEAVKYLKKYPRSKMVLSYHADYSNSGKNWLSLKILHGVIRKRYLDRAINYIEKIFPVVPASFVFLNEVYKIPLSKMELVPLGADSDLCDSVKNNFSLTDGLKKKYNITSDNIVLVTGGKFTPIKRTELLIEAANKLRNKKIILLIIGRASENDKSYYEMLRNMAASSSNIYFCGWQSTEGVYAHYHIADIAVFPASQSALWQQAIASGLPLIVGDIGHNSIAYLNKYNNLIQIEKNNINSECIAKNIKRLIDDKSLLKSMKLGAQKVSMECLDWNILIKKSLLI